MPLPAEARERHPLETWQPVPSDRTSLSLGELYYRAENDQVDTLPTSLDEMQHRLETEFGIQVPELLIEQVGMDHLRLVELSHPDSRARAWAAFESSAKTDHPEQARALVALTRSTGSLSLFMEDPETKDRPLTNRLTPDQLKVTGISSIGHVMSATYTGTYNRVEKSYKPHATYLLAEPYPDFVLTRLGVIGRKSANHHPIAGRVIAGLSNLLSEYRPLVTRAMIDHATAMLGIPQSEQSSLVDPEAYDFLRMYSVSREHWISHNSSDYGPLRTHQLGWLSHINPNPFYCSTIEGVNHFGRTDEWEVRAPDVLVNSHR